MKKAPREDIINHSEEDAYVRPQEPLLQQRLEWFRDMKLGFMVHWGGYSQWGLCESWPLSDGDADWSRRGIDWEKDAEKFKAEYIALNKTFNPVRFIPEDWASFASDNGFKYLIFTTKHHDGFCMYDSHYTDYKITGPECPFHTQPGADVTKRLFDAFRAKGLGIGAYFSKPDWHCPWYWAPWQDKPIACDRNPTYDPRKKPEIWNQYVDFTHAQIMELMERYGRIDILWLDGGQVNPKNGQDVRLREVIPRARKLQPWLLTADRTVGGEYENYITPEQQVPDHPISVPWESCVTVGSSFSFRFDDDYKSPRTLVQLLIDVISKGGNLALNIGAQPDGRLPRHAIQAAEGLGAWLKECGEAVYGTRMIAPCRVGKFAFTQKGDAKYLFYLPEEGERLPGELTAPVDFNLKSARIVPGGQSVHFEKGEKGLTLHIPENLIGASPLALVIRME